MPTLGENVVVVSSWSVEQPPFSHELEEERYVSGLRQTGVVLALGLGLKISESFGLRQRQPRFTVTVLRRSFLLLVGIADKGKERERERGLSRKACRMK